LINQQAFKGVLELDCVPVNDVLMLYINVHQFKGILTESIAMSFDTNSSNRNFFNALPLEKIALVELSLNQSEELFLYIQTMLTQIQIGSPQLQKLMIMTLTLYLTHDQIFKMNNFINQFISTYEMIRLNLATLQSKEESKIIADIAPITHESQIPEEEVEESSIKFENENDATEISLLNDCLIMSPSSIATYYISKQISNILNQPKKEKIHFEFDKQSVTIHLCPLMAQELIEISDDHYSYLLKTLASFEYSQEEYITKLRFLTRNLLYIINNYSKDNNTYFITVKVIEFLILLYTIKLSPSSLIGNLDVNHSSAQIFKQSCEYLVNYAIEHVLSQHIDQRKITHNQIIFKHYPNIEYFEDDFNDTEIRHLLAKELYLIDIDKEFFIKQVISKVDRKSANIDQNSAKLVFNKSTTINIPTILSTEPLNNNTWLDYQTIEPNQKQFNNHSIITKDYLQLLQLTNTPNISKSLLKDLDPILTKYANIIINQIFKELTVCDSKHAISTLNLLATHIRPYLHSDSTIKVDMYILYRIVIPHMYDVYNVDKFIDYFH